MNKGIITATVFLALILSGLSMSKNDAAANAKNIGKTDSSKQFPNLNGVEAENYLKDQGLYKSLGEAIAAARYSINPANNSPFENKNVLHASNPRQGYSTYFSTDGVHLVSEAKNNKWKIGMNLEEIGRGKDLSEIESGEMNVQANKSNIEIKKSKVQSPKSKVEDQSAITEWYKNTANGLEQGWTIAKRMNKSNDELKLVLSVESDLRMNLAEDKQAVDFVRENGSPVVRFDKLKSWDADGKELASRMELSDEAISIIVDDRTAKYPITVDPFFTQTKKLISSDVADQSFFGWAVSISGNTAIVTSLLDANSGILSGSAYIFERNFGGANIWNQAAKLTPSDAADSDEFGTSVSISGELAIVGAKGNGMSSEGAAYIFARNAGGANNWGEVKKLIASDAAASDEFGIKVAISGDTVIVGAAFNDDAGLGSGSAYIFERNTGGANNWGEVKKLTASDAAASDRFGISVGISGDTAIVGTPYKIEVNGSVGSAYIFERNTGGADNWGEVKKLIASDSSSGDFFGVSVAISGNTAVVGASLNDDNGNASGSAYIFTRNSGGADNWGEIKKITASNASENDVFGTEVGIFNDTIVVGADGTDRSGFDGAGSVYIFERNIGGANNWGQVQEITASDLSQDDRFGFRLGISEDTIIVGAAFKDDGGTDRGSAYVFTNQFNNWQEVTRKTSPDGEADDQLGSSVAISGDVVVVGAQFDDVGGNVDQGSAYIFERNVGGSDSWGAVTKITASDGAAGDEFGNSVGISGETVVVGASSDDSPTFVNQGSAYVFERNTGGAGNWGEVKKLVSSDGNASDFFGEAVAISEDTVVVGSVLNTNGGLNTGAGYIFSRNQGGADNWGEVKKITASDAASADRFGSSVAISVDTAIIGAKNNNDGGSRSGSAYIFARNTGGADNWGEVKKLTASDASSLDEFGGSVAISGDTAIVGAFQADGGGNTSGAAYIFERNTGGSNNWGEVKIINASDASILEQFGYSVGISGTRVIVGARRDDDNGSNTGSAYIYERNTGGANNWGEVKKLTASNPEDNDNFGYSVAISGDTIIIGTPFKDIPATLSKNSSGNTFRNATDLQFKSSQNLAGADQGAMYIFNLFAAPTSASADISGRVLKAKGGRGVPNAIVHLTDQNGNIWTARTNPFGYFRIDDIEVGQSLILNVYSKRYQFDTQVINLQDSISDLTIIAR